MSREEDTVAFDGLPLHPLVVHAPVVLVPLVAAGLVLVLVRPTLRRPLAPVLAVLAVVGAATAVGATWTGEALGEQLGRGDELEAHETFGELTRLLAVLVALGTTAVAVLDRRGERDGGARSVAAVTSGVALVAVGVVALTGHTGASLVWQGRQPGDASGTTAAPAPGAAPTESATTTPGEVAPTSASAAAPSSPLPGTGQPGVDVVLGEWALLPSVAEAPPGQVVFRFQNRGTVPHALRLRTPGSGGDRLEWRSATVAPGESGLLVADLATGTYELDCPVEDGHGEHDALGMETTFAIHDGAAALLPLPGTEDRPGVEEATSSPDRTASSAATVDVRGFAFAPSTVQVDLGGEVTWVNRDPAPHTATGDGFDTGSIAEGGTTTVRFDEPGTWTYVCTIHPAMRGTVVVDG